MKKVTVISMIFGLLLGGYLLPAQAATPAEYEAQQEALMQAYRLERVREDAAKVASDNADAIEKLQWKLKMLEIQVNRLEKVTK
jgi:hypothetical protein